MLRQRIITAVIGIPLFVYVLYVGGWFLSAVAAGLCLLASMEFSRLVRLTGVAVEPVLVYPLAVLLPLFAARLGITTVLASVTAVVVLTVVVTILRVLSGSQRSYLVLAESIPWTVMAVCYGPVIWAFLPLLRVHGLPWVFVAVGITWGTDTAAYFTGRLVGGPRFVPRLSPRKTWAGFAGGNLAGIVIAAVANRFFPFATIGIALALGLVGALAAQGGDLWVSLLKRHAGVKDAGRLLPGHGGVLDRFDSFAFVLVVVFLFSLFPFGG